MRWCFVWILWWFLHCRTDSQHLQSVNQDFASWRKFCLDSQRSTVQDIAFEIQRVHWIKNVIVSSAVFTGRKCFRSNLLVGVIQWCCHCMRQYICCQLHLHAVSNLEIKQIFLRQFGCKSYWVSAIHVLEGLEMGPSGLSWTLTTLAYFVESYVYFSAGRGI